MSFTSPEWVTIVSSGVFNEAISAGVWAFLGLLFSITITLLIMHSHTTDRRGGRFGAYALIILLGITFNVFTETASTMDRVDERVLVKSEQSGVFKALTGSIKNSSAQSNQAYIKAQAEYADRLSTKNFRCNKRKKQDYDRGKCATYTMQTAEAKIKMELFSKGGKI